MALSLRFYYSYKSYINNRYLRNICSLFYQNHLSFRALYFLPQNQDPRKTPKYFLMRGKIQIFSRGRCKAVLAIKR